MYSRKKTLWLVAVVALALVVIVALKTASFSDKKSSPRGILVGRVDYYGC